MARTHLQIKAAYHNTGPYRHLSRIIWEEKSFGKNVTFCLNDVVEQHTNIDATERLAWLNAYIAEHAQELSDTPIPQRFTIPQQSDHCFDKEVLCSDLNLTIAIVGRIAGHIYIPNRPIQITQEHLCNYYTLLKKDLDE